jgi:transposase
VSCITPSIRISAAGMDLHLRGRDAALSQELDVTLRWQRLPAFEKLAHLAIDHLDGILNYCRVKVRFGVVEAINGNIKTLLRRGRGYKNLRYLLLKAQRMAVTKTEFVAFRKAA